MIADSLKAVVTYDSLTIYRVDRAAWVRRAVVARDRFAELILQHEAPLDAGITGWASATRGGPRQRRARRPALDPDPGHARGAGVDDRRARCCRAARSSARSTSARMGGDEAHFSRDEFELAQLFAGQASIALRNAEAHGAVDDQAEHDALTGLRNHGAFQLEIGRARRTASSRSPADARPRRVQGLQRHERPPRGRRAARPGRRGDERRDPRRATGSTATAATSSR